MKAHTITINNSTFTVQKLSINNPKTSIVHYLGRRYQW